jgi:hypothetical protein
MIMRKFQALAASLAFTCSIPLALAAEGTVAISSPAEGAKISPKTDVELVYDISLGDKGDHTHLYIDEKEILTLRNLKGSQSLGTLAAGKHEICVKVVNKAHTPIGPQKCVNVNVEA